MGGIVPTLSLKEVQVTKKGCKSILVQISIVPFHFLVLKASPSVHLTKSL